MMAADVLCLGASQYSKPQGLTGSFIAPCQVGHLLHVEIHAGSCVQTPVWSCIGRLAGVLEEMGGEPQNNPSLAKKNSGAHEKRQFNISETRSLSASYDVRDRWFWRVWNADSSGIEPPLFGCFIHFTTLTFGSGARFLPASPEDGMPNPCMYHPCQGVGDCTSLMPSWVLTIPGKWSRRCPGLHG